MYVIVVGGGEAGYYIAKALLNSAHEVLVIESDERRCAIIGDNLGNIVVRGDGCEAATLEDVGTNRADILIAVTGDDEDNLVACQVAKHKFNVPRTIARLKNPKHERLFKKLGVDVTVSSTNLVLANIKQELPDNPLASLLAIKGGGLEVVSVKIPSDSIMDGKPLSDIELPDETLICLIVRKEGSSEIPKPATELAAADEVIAITIPENETALKKMLLGITD